MERTLRFVVVGHLRVENVRCYVSSPSIERHSAIVFILSAVDNVHCRTTEITTTTTIEFAGTTASVDNCRPVPDAAAATCAATGWRCWYAPFPTLRRSLSWPLHAISIIVVVIVTGTDGRRVEQQRLAMEVPLRTTTITTGVGDLLLLLLFRE